MIIGYGRTSTIEQVAALEAQIWDLKAAGAEKLFRENVSSVAPRQQLEAAIEFAREGDSLVVTKIDRLARSVRHLCEIVDRLQAKGVALRILNMNLDTNDATGKLMLQIIGSIAEFVAVIIVILAVALASVFTVDAVAAVGGHRQGKGGRQISRRHPHSSRQS
jgi:DNA invertase Pin-like site-specific DNA recombinase